MDAFHSSAEQRDGQSEAKGKPVIIRPPPTQRAVVAGARYEAWKFGVRPAMPNVTAGKLSPAGVFVRPRMEACRAESQAITPLVRDLVVSTSFKLGLDGLGQGDLRPPAATSSIPPFGDARQQALRVRRGLGFETAPYELAAYPKVRVTWGGAELRRTFRVRVFSHR